MDNIGLFQNLSMQNVINLIGKRLLLRNALRKLKFETLSEFKRWVGIP